MGVNDMIDNLNIYSMFAYQNTGNEYQFHFKPIFCALIYDK